MVGPTTSPPEDELPPGTQLGAFTIEAVLGRSDRCTVYRAHQVALRREVALKVLREDPYDARAAQERELFLADLCTAASVQDPLLVQVLDIPAAAEHCYASLELVKGRSLADRTSAGQRLSWQEVVAVLADVLQASRDPTAAAWFTAPSSPPTCSCSPPAVACWPTPAPRRGAAAANCRATRHRSNWPVNQSTIAPISTISGASRMPRWPDNRRSKGCARHRRRPARVQPAEPARCGSEHSAGLDELRASACWPSIRPIDRPPPRLRAPNCWSRARSPRRRRRAAGRAPAAAIRSKLYAARPELRRRPPPRSKVLLARLAAESIIFTIHFVVVVGLLLLLKLAGGFDIYQMLPAR